MADAKESAEQTGRVGGLHRVDEPVRVGPVHCSVSSGSVFMDDEDEFARNQRRYDYPRDLVTRAERTAEWLSTALYDGVEPFGSRFRTWLDQVG